MSSKSLAFFQTRTLGLAYSLANQCAKAGAKVFEIFPVGNHGHVVLDFGDQDLIKEIANTFESGVLNEAYIPLVSEKTLKTYLSQENSPIVENLLIVESEFVGNCFFAAEILLKNQCELVDLRLFRGQDKYSVLMGTTKNAELAQKVKSILSAENLECSLITQVSSELI